MSNLGLLNNHGIEVVRGCSGNATEIVKLYISGHVKDNGESCKQHSEHSHQGNECGHNDHA